MRARWERLADWRATEAGRRAARDAAFLAVLFALVWAAYGPALRHPPRADQWCYLADTLGEGAFAPLLRDTYSYNRTRRVAPGDTDLFRPVLFAVLAAEKAAFEGRLALHQGTGIVLHCAVCALLLVAVRAGAALVRAPGAPPAGDALSYAAVAFFALNPCVVELVIWAHLHGYLLFQVLLLGSLACTFRYCAGGTRAALAGAWLLALMAAFTYELGQFYAALAGVACAARAGSRRRAALVLLAFAGIGGLYQAANRLDAARHRGSYEPERLSGEILRRAFEPATATHAARFAVFTGVQPFVPGLVQASYSGDRVQVAESVWGGSRLRVLTPGLLVSYAVLLLGGALALAGVRGLLACGLFALAASGAERVWEVNARVARDEKPLVRSIRAVQAFVDAHRHEPGFAFEIDYAASDPLVPIHGHPRLHLVFGEWTARPNPTYRVTVRDGKALAQPLPSAASP